MRTHRPIWAVMAAVGAVVAVAGLVWLFVALGTEEADRISSGVGAGAAVLGLVVAGLGVMKRRATTPDDADSVAPVQSVANSLIKGSNVQIGGSVHGSVTASESETGDHPAS